jgi:hypothetical protein
MQTHGSDHARTAGGKVILHSSLPKGWTPRTPKTHTHAEHPGTTVTWDDQTLEVLEATALPTGGVRYVLAPWRDDHTIRTIERYDAESEAKLQADADRARRQRRTSVLARLSGIFLGHLPASMQTHLQNELGVAPVTLTLMSCLGILVMDGFLAVAAVDAIVHRVPTRIPVFVWPLAGLLTAEMIVRYFIVMSQGRGVGSVLGTLAYVLYRAVAPKGAALPPVFGTRGDAITFTPPEEDVALRDSLEVRGAWLTLLSPAEQQSLADRYGFDYRRDAFGITWIILGCALLGMFTSYAKMVGVGSVSAFIALLVAAVIAIEQVLRLISLRRGPAGSMFAVIVRPFMRDLLR